MRFWSFPDRVSGHTGTSVTPAAGLPGPLGIAGYARLRRTGDDLPRRLRLLVDQLAAERSGCPWCAHRNRHLALQAGVSAADLDHVTCFASAPGYAEPERAALGLADAITRFSEAEGGFPMEILVGARRHFAETEIMALVGTVTGEHFFDPRTGRMGRDVMELEARDDSLVASGDR